jgi:hypothetical protein
MERYSDLSRAEPPIVTLQLAKSDFHAVTVKRKRWDVPILEHDRLSQVQASGIPGTPKGITLRAPCPRGMSSSGGGTS